MKKIGEFLKKIYELVTKPEMKTLPGQLAFFFVLSLIPLIALVGFIATCFSVSSSGVLSLLQNTLPNGVAELFTPIATGITPSSSLVVFFVTTFILASNGTNSMITAANTIYHEDSQTILKKRLKAIFMLFILVGLFTFVLLVPVIGETVFQFFQKNGRNDVISMVYQVYRVLKLPLGLTFTYLNLKILYMIAPDKKVNHKTTRKGAIFTTIMWFAIVKIYTFYVETIAHYDAFYGSLSNILILMLFVYFLSYAFVIGMALNASSGEETNES